jgi:hypothetical protein
MRVYAEYFEEKGLKYRRSTLLQLGNSWDLIGSAVLANPGSAKPIREVTEEEQEQLRLFYTQNREESFNPNNWFIFSDDATMQRVEKIFNGWYIDPENTLKLNGVIQLFNTFNIKNQDLEEAIDSVSLKSELLFSKGIEKYFNDKPTYFGFSNDVLNDDRLYPIAKEIFENSSETVKSIYNNDFDKNSFYHPTFVNRAYKREFFQNYKNDILLKLRENIEYPDIMLS